jgi:DNA-binding NarL/FixJ family response regulator
MSAPDTALGPEPGAPVPRPIPGTTDRGLDVGPGMYHVASSRRCGATVSTRRTTVLIVEDDPVLRDSFADLLSGVDGIEVVGAVGSLRAASRALDGRPDVVLLDLALPDGSGLELIAAMRTRSIATKTIVISVFGDVRSVVRAIEEGADGYLLKDADAGHVEAAVRTVMRGEAPISPAVAGHILARMRNDASHPSDPRTQSQRGPQLTPKETDVLEALARGRSVKEVAHLHAISVHTVGDHVKAIYRKLSASSRGEAVFKAVQAGLIRIEG